MKAIVLENRHVNYYIFTFPRKLVIKKIIKLLNFFKPISKMYNFLIFNKYNYIEVSNMKLCIYVF